MLRKPSPAPFPAMAFRDGPATRWGWLRAVAFRNITITDFDKKLPILKDIKYAVYKGKFESGDYKKTHVRRDLLEYTINVSDHWRMNLLPVTPAHSAYRSRGLMNLTLMHQAVQAR